MPFPEVIDFSSLPMKHIGMADFISGDTPPVTYFVIIGPGAQELIRVASDGTVTLAEGLSIDDASILFWQKLQELAAVSQP